MAETMNTMSPKIMIRSIGFQFLRCLDSMTYLKVDQQRRCVLLDWSIPGKADRFHWVPQRSISAFSSTSPYFSSTIVYIPSSYKSTRQTMTKHKCNQTINHFHNMTTLTSKCQQIKCQSYVINQMSNSKSSTLLS